jgi:hypothetical protein
MTSAGTPFGKWLWAHTELRCRECSGSEPDGPEPWLIASLTKTGVPEPDEFIWNRRIRRSLEFGRGQHFCISYHLARLNPCAASG